MGHGRGKGVPLSYPVLETHIIQALSHAFMSRLIKEGVVTKEMLEERLDEVNVGNVDVRRDDRLKYVRIMTS